MKPMHKAPPKKTKKIIAFILLILVIVSGVTAYNSYSAASRAQQIDKSLDQMQQEYQKMRSDTGFFSNQSSTTKWKNLLIKVENSHPEQLNFWVAPDDKKQLEQKQAILTKKITQGKADFNLQIQVNRLFQDDQALIHYKATDQPISSKITPSNITALKKQLTKLKDTPWKKQLLISVNKAEQQLDTVLSVKNQLNKTPEERTNIDQLNNDIQQVSNKKIQQKLSKQLNENQATEESTQKNSDKIITSKESAEAVKKSTANDNKINFIRDIINTAQLDASTLTDQACIDLYNQNITDQQNYQQMQQIVTSAATLLNKDATTALAQFQSRRPDETAQIISQNQAIQQVRSQFNIPGSVGATATFKQNGQYWFVTIYEPTAEKDRVHQRFFYVTKDGNNVTEENFDF